MKRFILLGLLGGLLATNTGCGLLQAVFCCHPCGRCGDCVAGCGDCCDEGCGPRCGPATRWGGPPRGARGCADCGTDCGGGCGPVCRGGCGRCGSPCDDPCADPCGNGCCGRVWHRGPLSCVFACLMRGWDAAHPGAEVVVAKDTGVITTMIHPIAATRATAAATIWAAVQVAVWAATQVAIQAALRAADAAIAAADMTAVPAASTDTVAVPSLAVAMTACQLPGTTSSRNRTVLSARAQTGPPAAQGRQTVAPLQTRIRGCSVRSLVFGLRS